MDVLRHKYSPWSINVYIDIKNSSLIRSMRKPRKLALVVVKLK